MKFLNHHMSTASERRYSSTMVHLKYHESLRETGNLKPGILRSGLCSKRYSVYSIRKPEPFSLRNSQRIPLIPTASSEIILPSTYQKHRTDPGNMHRRKPLCRTYLSLIEYWWKRAAQRALLFLYFCVALPPGPKAASYFTIWKSTPGICVAPGGTCAVDTNIPLSFRLSAVLLRGFVRGGYVVPPPLQ